MKKITVPVVREESQLFCDKHRDVECFSRVSSSSWYGSGFDLMRAEVHMCDNCLSEFYQRLKDEFGVEPQDHFP